MKDFIPVILTFLFIGCATESKEIKTSNKHPSIEEQVTPVEPFINDCGYDNLVTANYYDHEKKDSLIERSFVIQYSQTEITKDGTIVFLASDKLLGENPLSTFYKDENQHVIKVIVDGSKHNGSGSKLDCTELGVSSIEIQGFGSILNYNIYKSYNLYEEGTDSIFEITKLEDGVICLNIHLFFNRNNGIYFVKGQLFGSIDEDERD